VAELAEGVRETVVLVSGEGTINVKQSRRHRHSKRRFSRQAMTNRFVSIYSSVADWMDDRVPGVNDYILAKKMG
jgi:hypothetical protein